MRIYCVCVLYKYEWWRVLTAYKSKTKAVKHARLAGAFAQKVYDRAKKVETKYFEKYKANDRYELCQKSVVHYDPFASFMNKCKHSPYDEEWSGPLSLPSYWIKILEVCE